MENIQNKVEKIHSQYGTSELANYKIQLLYQQYAKEYYDSKVKKLNIPDVTNWIAVTDAFPKPFQTVWLTNGEGWVCLGCLVETNKEWHWAESNGVMYVENGEIVSECESEDLDVKFWHKLPKPPCL